MTEPQALRRRRKQPRLQTRNRLVNQIIDRVDNVIDKRLKRKKKTRSASWFLKGWGSECRADAQALDAARGVRIAAGLGAILPRGYS
jgi:hypothetical protein